MATTEGKKTTAGDTTAENKITEEKAHIAEAKAQIDEIMDDQLLTALKLRAYEEFHQGKITRGALDRRIDEFYAGKQRAEATNNPQPAETPRQPIAEKIIQKNMWWSAGFGILPLPGVDLIGLTTVQIVMLRSLCDLYEVPFSREWGKQTVSALVGGFAPSYAKGIPGIGTLVGVVTGPIFYAASTYAIGKVFTQHFESGGTLLSFDPAKMKEYFREYFEAGKKLARSHSSN
jgi:uncharacterized protein (DUF697 family)